MLNRAPVKPNSAFALIFTGAALIFLNRAHAEENLRFYTAGKVAALLAAAIGAIVLVEYLIGAGTALDTIFIPDGMLIRPAVRDVRMSRLAAFALTLLGAGLAFGRTSNRKHLWIGDIAFSITAGLTLIGLLSFAYGALPIGGLGHAMQVPIPAVMLSFLIALGGILLRPDSRLVRPFISAGAGGKLIAQMLPFVIIVPFALGSLHITQMLSPENASMQAALSSAITAIVFALVIWKSADELNKLDARKNELDRERAALAIRAEREEELSLLNERYRYVAKATNDAVWDLDVASNKLVWNESVHSLFGYGPDEVGSDLTWWEDRVHPEDRARVVDTFHRAVSDGSEIWHSSYRFRNADDSWSSVVDRGYIIRDPEGRARRAIGAMSDRTTQIALEETLRHSQKMDAVGQLSAGVAHDFNNVLALISISADFLLQKIGPDEEHHGEVTEIKKAADRGSRLTKQLLAFTRQQLLSAVPLNLNTALDEMVGMLHRLLSERVELVVDREPNLRLIKVDGGQMEQITLNLVLNARDSMPDGGVVRIETANVSGSVPCLTGVVSGDFVTLTVSDTGTGIPRDVLNRIFDPFFTTKEIGQGTGLGLATVLGIVKQSGGDICVDSGVGSGSRFTVYFPAYDAEQSQESADSPVSGEAVMVGGETILVVEDDDALRSAVERILVRAGYKVLTASNGAEGLEVGGAHPGRIALVLTDARMPVMGGAELVRRIREERIDTRVLVMSGYTDEIEAGMVEGGAIPFIGKPFDNEALLGKVRSVIQA